MDAEELLKIKHISGFSNLFENVDYGPAWVTNEMLRIKKDFISKNGKLSENVTG